MALRLSLYSSQSAWWHTDYPYTHHSLACGSDNPYTHHKSPSWYPDYYFTRHSLPGGTRTIPILITVSLVVLIVSLYSSQSPWLMSDYPYTHHSFPRCTQTIPLLIKSALWYSNYILITFSLVVPRLSLYSSQSA